MRPPPSTCPWRLHFRRIWAPSSNVVIVITKRALEPKPSTPRTRYGSILSTGDGKKHKHVAVCGATSRSHFYQRLVRRWCAPYHWQYRADRMTFCALYLTKVDTWFEPVMIGNMRRYERRRGLVMLVPRALSYQMD